MFNPPFESKLVCYSFDYGNRSVLKEPLKKLLNKYNEQVLGVMPFVNNNPYLLEFYIIFDCEKVVKKGIIALSLSGKSLYASNTYLHDWEPISRKFVVNRVKNNRIYTHHHAFITQK